jgi:hypothetical protein
MDAMASRNLAAVILDRSRKLSLQADFASLLSGAVVPFAVTGALLALLASPWAPGISCAKPAHPCSTAPADKLHPDKTKSGNSRPIPNSPRFANNVDPCIARVAAARLQCVHQSTLADISRLIIVNE